MSKYTYQFIEVPAKGGFKTKTGDTFAECKAIILAEAEKGWRFRQIVTPYNEKMGVYGAAGYQIIFEKELD